STRAPRARGASRRSRRTRPGTSTTRSARAAATTCAERRGVRGKYKYICIWVGTGVRLQHRAHALNAAVECRSQVGRRKAARSLDEPFLELDQLVGRCGLAVFVA